MSFWRAYARRAFSFSAMSRLACSIWVARNSADWPIWRNRESMFHSMYASATPLARSAASLGVGAECVTWMRLVPRTIVASVFPFTREAALAASTSGGAGRGRDSSS